MEEKIKLNKEIAQIETELAFFWEIMSGYLPKSVERSALGDSKIFYAFKATYPKIKDFIRNQTLEEARGCVPKEQAIFRNATNEDDKKVFHISSGFNSCRQQTLSNLEALKKK